MRGAERERREADEGWVLFPLHERARGRLQRVEVVHTRQHSCGKLGTPWTVPGSRVELKPESEAVLFRASEGASPSAARLFLGPCALHRSSCGGPMVTPSTGLRVLRVHSVRAENASREDHRERQSQAWRTGGCLPGWRLREDPSGPGACFPGRPDRCRGQTSHP